MRRILSFRVARSNLSDFTPPASRHPDPKQQIIHQALAKIVASIRSHALAFAAARRLTIAFPGRMRVR